jgi:hypothetical protein
MVIVEKLVEWRLAGVTEVLGEYLPQRHVCPSQNPTWPDQGLNAGRRGGKSATNRLSYGAAMYLQLASCIPFAAEATSASPVHTHRERIQWN